MNNFEERILIFRFSAMGDVAMTAPVLKEFSQQNPKVQLLIVSRKGYQSFFKDIPNSIFIGIDFKAYQGILGLKKLTSELIEKYKPTQVADLHNVLRTKVLKLFFSFQVKKIATLKKGRKERKLLTKYPDKSLFQLRHITEKYADVFRELGFEITLSHQLFPSKSKKKNSIGIAPFANYKEKMYPLDKMKNISLELAKKGYQVYLLGGKGKEQETLEEWSKEHINIHSLAGKFSLQEEMEVISELSLVISMDSANMHIASLVGTQVLSIWGATHPFAGFLGYGQKQENIIQTLELDCRPCSIFGNKLCFRKDLACMNLISEAQIIEKVEKIKN